MSWDYRIINHDAKNNGDWLVIHEVYYDKDGQISMYSSRGSEICGESIEEVNSVLMMLRSASKKPILSEKELKKYFRRRNKEQTKPKQEIGNE